MTLDDALTLHNRCRGGMADFATGTDGHAWYLAARYDWEVEHLEVQHLFWRISSWMPCGRVLPANPPELAEVDRCRGCLTPPTKHRSDGRCVSPPRESVMAACQNGRSRTPTAVPNTI